MPLDRSGFASVLLACLFAASAASAADQAAGQDLADLSLDQLMGITVTSASKKAQNADEVSSAIFVLTSEDIRRSGATSIPEVLRLVPGLQVAQYNANSWAITARGFNGRFASKLLVLIDGRSVYTPLFSGVYWDVQDTLMEDIERIEVIRGPGATVWGANALNGVINIITKKAEATQGLLSQAGTGTEERGFAGLRYGGKLGEDLHYRVYGKYFDRDSSQTGTGARARDDWDMFRGGFRMEWTPTDDDLVTLQGDGYDGDAGISFTGLAAAALPMVTFNEDQQLHGWNMIGRWSHAFSETMDASAQVYYDRTDRSSPLVDEIRHTYDFEVQHRFALPFNQEVIWGGGYRYTEDRTTATFSTALLPSRRHDDTFSLFVQDEIRFFEDKVRLTVGTKVENNDYTGWEYQPSARIAWLPHEHHMLWSSVSRALRTPNRADDGILLNQQFVPFQLAGVSPLDGVTPCPCPATLVQGVGTGTRTSESERLYAFEAGWRGHFFERVTVDVAAFRNDYNYLQDFTVGPIIPTGPASINLQNLLANTSKQRTWGVETDLRADLMDWWRVIIGYTYLNQHESALSASHQGVVRSQLDLPFDLELDATLYLIGNVANLDGVDAITVVGAIPSYERLDLRLGWRPNEKLELSLVGQNLLDHRHPEFLSELGIAASEIQRSFYGKVTYRY
jgi:iron complex outermembrane receptor protein